MIHYREAEYGFEYGSAKVTRTSSDNKKGWVVISVDTPKQSIQVYVTKTGKVRVHNSRGGEWGKP
jgi:hypothetical protein